MKTILIIEDDIVFCKMLSKFLTKNDFHALDAQSAEEGLQLARNESIDIILIDNRLPDQIGIEVLKTIKSEKPKTKLLLMSRFDESNLSEQVAEIGGNGFLTKPFEADELLRILSSL